MHVLLYFQEHMHRAMKLALIFFLARNLLTAG